MPTVSAEKLILRCIPLMANALGTENIATSGTPIDGRAVGNIVSHQKGTFAHRALMIELIDISASIAPIEHLVIGTMFMSRMESVQAKGTVGWIHL